MEGTTKMNEELKSLIDDYKKTDWSSLLQVDHGKYHLREIKPHLDFIKNFTDNIVKKVHLLSHNQQNTLVDLISQFQNYKEQINNYEGKSQRETIINQIVNFKGWIQDNCQQLELSLAIHDKYKPLDKIETKLNQTESKNLLYQPQEEKLSKELKKLVEEKFEKEIRNLKQLQSQYAEQTVRVEASRYGDFFKKTAKNNKVLSWIFGGVFLFACILAAWFAYCFLKFDKNIIASSFVELLIKGDVINKVFIFSVILIVISIIKREYFALRHQFTLNTHRHNALSSHKEILSSIKKTANESDREISNAILLELTKAMFDSQDTGFVKDQKYTSDSKVVEVSKTVFSNSKDK